MITTNLDCARRYHAHLHRIPITMKKLLAVLALLPLACQTNMQTQTETAAAPPRGRLEVLPGVELRLRQLPKTSIDYDRSLLNDNERAVVAKLIEASKFIDEIYWRQVSEQNPDYRKQLAAQVTASERDRAGYEYFIAHKGRWDRIAQDEPFIEPFGAAGHKPEGAAFYPSDLTKEEMERYIAAHPEQKDALQGLFTVVRRQGDRLVSIPYSVYYREFLEPAAARIREAAALTNNASLRDYLTRLADAFFKDNYRESDIAWMDLNGPLEVIIGP